MKMVMAVVSRDQADLVLDSLVAAGYAATFTESRGGMLRQAQQMLFLGGNAGQVPAVLEIIRSRCRTSVDVAADVGEGPTGKSEASTHTVAEVGYAAVFVWDLDRIELY